MWRTRIGIALVGLIGLGIGYVGISYLVDPLAQAPAFVGSAAPDPAHSLGNAKGVRDLVTGIAIAVLLLARQPRIAGWFAIGGALIPAGDAVVVLANGGATWTALGVHGATAVAALVGGVLLVRGGARTRATRVAATEPVGA